MLSKNYPGNESFTIILTDLWYFSQRWFLATKSLSQIFISRILISGIVYENLRVLAVIGEIMQHYGLSAPCDLGYVNERISGTFTERLFVLDYHVDGHVLNSLCTFRPAVTRSYKD